MADNTPVTPSGPLLSDLWEHHGAPTEQEVLNFITQKNQTHTPLETNGDTATDQCTWESPPNRLCSSSFGDKGMTATVNAYGLLMQFGDYLGAGRSGLFSADHEFVDELYQTIDRAETLDKVTKQSSLEDKSYGISLDGLELRKESVPKMSWKNWRWPCYEYSPGCFSNPDLSLTVEWMVHKKILIQRCTVDNKGTSICKIDMSFLKDLRIRDLDHTGNYANPKLVPGALESGSGPGQYTWLWRMPYTFETTGKSGGKSDNDVQARREIEESDNEMSDQKPGSMTSHQDENETNTQSITTQEHAVKRLQYFGLQEMPDSPSKPTPRIAETEETIPAKSKETTPETKTIDPFTVVVVAAVFVNGKPRKFGIPENPGSPSTWTETWSERSESELERPQRLEITTAYRMLLMPAIQGGWQDLLISAKDVNMDLFLSKDSLNSRQLLSVNLTDLPLSFRSSNDVTQTPGDQPVSTTRYDAPTSGEVPQQMKVLSGLPTNLSSPSEHLNYVMWRNLEHILSVCSIPVGPSIADRTGSEIQPIALTCGDMSLHRVCNSASFFAIQFLLEIAKRLALLAEKPQCIKTLQSRIRSVCLGHLKWLIDTEKPVADCFAANYWVTGKVYPEEDKSDSWHADDGLTDTPFQIIKAADTFSVYQDEAAKILCERLLSQVQSPWLKLLSSQDPRVKFAWPHAREESINIFRLDDHVWIWRALKALASMDMWKTWTRGFDNKKYTIVDIQREILQRFTTKTDESGRRMLAVTRSVRESRFLFHARDTALFYGPNLEFFQLNSSFREPWGNTIHAQAYHDDNQKMLWDNAIRYALTIAGSASGLRTNTYKGAATLVRDAVVTLFQTTSPNGFFPGQLDENAGECPAPVLYGEEQYRDFYFHAHFEICYTLLVNLNRLCDKWFETSDGSYTDMPNATISPISLPYPSRSAAKDSETQPIVTADMHEGKWLRQDANKTKDIRISMKKSFPRGSSLDSRKIVDIDEEWLYEYPSFFDNANSPHAFDEIPTLIEDDEVVKTRIHPEVLETSKTGKLVFSDGPLDSAVKVFDVPKQKHVGKRNRRQKDFESVVCNTRKDLWDKLSGKRTAEGAKKRLIFLPEPKVRDMLICYLTTHMSERAPIDSFFRSMGSFVDITGNIYNYWDTELVFVFQILADKNEQPQQTGQGFHSETPMLGRRRTMRCRLGFFFQGDIFDRHWTCHVLGSEHTGIDSTRLDSIIDRTSDWRQRKVLELLLLTEMIIEVEKKTIELLEEHKLDLSSSAESFATLSSEEYLRTSHKRLEVTKGSLESVDKDLTSVFDNMTRWDNREVERAQQPRWTRNDERKYRESITRLRAGIVYSLTDLRRTHADTKALRDKFDLTLTRNLVKIAEGRSLRESENMRLFTYVTVVFLPLGFAASIFSMGGTPETSLLVNMIICAIVALFLTVIMLINAKRLASMAKSASDAIHEYSKDKMEASAMIKLHKSSGYQVSQKTRRAGTEKSWFLWFWLKYMLFEVPACRVIIACQILKLTKSTLEGPGDTQLPTATQGDVETFESLPTQNSVATGASSHSWAVLQVLGGFVCSPLFVTSWFLQIVALNLFDLLCLSVHLLSRLMSTLPSTQIDTFPAMWLTRQELWRPIRMLDQRVKGGRNAMREQDKSDPPKDEGLETDRTSAEDME
ncbi:hypothetical protein G7054_g5426 [Neopestalotiopsis clavispora]|nr:hypothetical protein G7054_g5426 [Neopestalotiopsis clavispora]